MVAAEEAFLASTARLGQPIAATGEAVLPAAPGAHTLLAQGVIERAMAEDAIARIADVGDSLSAAPLA